MIEFVDDMAAVFVSDSKEYDFRLLSLWFASNKSCFNVEKIVCVKHTCDSFSHINCVKYLGLLVDENLNWKEHIAHVKKSCLMFLRQFFYLKALCPDSVLHKLYYAFVRPKLNYAISIWAGTHNSYEKAFF